MDFLHIEPFSQALKGKLSGISHFSDLAFVGLLDAVTSNNVSRTVA